MQPSWTIALPTYNGAEHLAETLQSVLQQTDAHFELIACDDASTDNTLALVRSLCGHRAIVHTNQTGQPLGLAANWNRCIHLATGDWLTILHQDDLLAPDFIKCHRQWAATHPYLGMITSPAEMIDANSQPITQASLGEFQWPECEFICWPEHALSRVLVHENPIRCPATSLQRSLAKQLGGFDGGWKYVVDWAFWHRLGQAAPVGLTGRRLASQRWHGSSETQKLARGTTDLEENAQIMRLILSGPPFTEAERPLVESKIRHRLAQAWWTRAWQAAKRGDRSLEKTALKQAICEQPALVLKWALTQPKTMARLLFGKR